MKKIEKMDRIDHVKYNSNKPTGPNAPEEELKFILWKAELNKELMSFWKSMVLGKED